MALVPSDAGTGGRAMLADGQPDLIVTETSIANKLLQAAMDVHVKKNDQCKTDLNAAIQELKQAQQAMSPNDFKQLTDLILHDPKTEQVMPVLSAEHLLENMQDINQNKKEMKKSDLQNFAKNDQDDWITNTLDQYAINNYDKMRSADSGDGGSLWYELWLGRGNNGKLTTDDLHSIEKHQQGVAEPLTQMDTPTDAAAAAKQQLLVCSEYMLTTAANFNRGKTFDFGTSDGMTLASDALNHVLTQVDVEKSILSPEQFQKYLSDIENDPRTKKILPVISSLYLNMSFDDISQKKSKFSEDQLRSFIGSLRNSGSGGDQFAADLAQIGLGKFSELAHGHKTVTRNDIWKINYGGEPNSEENSFFLFPLYLAMLYAASSYGGTEETFSGSEGEGGEGGGLDVSPVGGSGGYGGEGGSEGGDGGGDGGGGD